MVAIPFESVVIGQRFFHEGLWYVTSIGHWAICEDSGRHRFFEEDEMVEVAEEENP